MTKTKFTKKMRILFLLLTVFLFTCSFLFGQEDLISLVGFKNLQKHDTLIIDYKNMNCYTTTGDRLLIYHQDSAFVVLRFVDFHIKLILDDKELNDKAKQVYRQSLGDFETVYLSMNDFNSIMNNFENLSKSNHENCVVIAGFYSEIFFQLNAMVVKRRFRCPIEISTLNEIEMKHFELPKN